MKGVRANIIHVTIDGESLDLIEENSVEYDAGESTNDFAMAAKEITKTYHEGASPTLDWTSTLDRDASGLEAAGVIDGETGDVMLGNSRRLSNIAVEYLAKDDATLEGKLIIPRGTLEWGGIDGQSPPTMDFTLHINEHPTWLTEINNGYGGTYGFSTYGIA